MTLPFFTCSAFCGLVLGAHVGLPVPTGPHQVGCLAYHWTDTNRPEPFSEKTEAKREVMVYVWYPAEVERDAPRAKYLPDFKAIEKCAGEGEMRDLLGASYATVKAGNLSTHAANDAKMSSDKKQYPVLLFSPGFGEFSLTYSAVLEDLASYGYVVVAIEHPYDATCVVFPDGRSIPFAQERWDKAKKEAASMMAYYGSRVEAWAADTRFVLNRLERFDRAPLAGRLDFQRVGIFGHSVGGMTAARVCELDTRIRAGMNQDSDFEGKPYMPGSSAKNIKQPFLFFVSRHSFFQHMPAPTDKELAAQKLTREEFNRLIGQFDKNQEEALASMPGGSYRVAVVVPSFNHRSFIDAALLKAGDDQKAVTENMRNLKIVRTYTRAFFDKHLKDIKKTSLDEIMMHNEGVRVDRFGPGSR